MKTFKIKRLEPVNMLPALKELQHSRKIFHAPAADLAKPSEQKKRLSMNSQDSSMMKEPPRSHFVTQNNSLEFAETLLREGYFDSFESLFIACDLGTPHPIPDSEVRSVLDQVMQAEQFHVELKSIESNTKLFEIGNTFLAKKRPKNAAFFFQKGIKQLEEALTTLGLPSSSSENKNLLLEVLVKLKLAYSECLFLQSKKKEATKVLEEASVQGVQGSKSLEQVIEKLIDVYQDLATDAEERKDFNSAADQLDKCVALCKQVDSRDLQVKVLLRKALLLLHMGRSFEALEVSKKCVEDSAGLSEENKANSYKLLAQSYHAKGDLDQATSNYRIYNQLTRGDGKSKLDQEAVKSSADLGVICWEKGDIEESLACFRRGFEDALEIKKSRGLTERSRVMLALASGLASQDQFRDTFIGQEALDRMLAIKKQRLLW